MSQICSPPNIQLELGEAVICGCSNQITPKSDQKNMIRNFSNGCQGSRANEIPRRRLEYREDSVKKNILGRPTQDSDQFSLKQNSLITKYISWDSREIQVDWSQVLESQITDLYYSFWEKADRQYRLPQD